MDQKTAFLCGVGGSGMSALARLLMARGWAVAGSDRSRDKGETPEKFAALAAGGIRFYPQDGSGVAAAKPDMLVVSSAVEDTVPDVKAAKDAGVEIRKRADVLAAQFNAAEISIGVGGTSGKSTVTAMTGWIFERTGRAPVIVNGALMNNFGGANAVIGGGKNFIAEVDESDGSIALFRPSVAIVTNITLDHKPMEELRRLFGGFWAASRTAVANLDDRESAALAPPGAMSFSLVNPAARFQVRDIKPAAGGSAFTVVDTQDGESAPVTLRVPGRHNVANALAAMAAARAARVGLAEAAAALADFSGLQRRFQIIGTARGVTVIDDFAHNPDKIVATLSALYETPGRVWAVFQPHGFGPTKMMRRELADTFARFLKAGDSLVMPEIYYAGGTASRDISSRDIIGDVVAQGSEAYFVEKRGDIAAFLAARAKPGDRIVVMGARDDTLSAFARDILAAL